MPITRHRKGEREKKKKNGWTDFLAISRQTVHRTRRWTYINRFWTNNTCVKRRRIVRAPATVKDMDNKWWVILHSIRVSTKRKSGIVKTRKSWFISVIFLHCISTTSSTTHERNIRKLFRSSVIPSIF